MPRRPTLAEMLMHLAMRYQIKIVCDLGGPYTVEDEKFIRLVENLHKEPKP